MSHSTRSAVLFTAILLLAACEDPTAKTELVFIPEVTVEALALDEDEKPVATISNAGETLFEGECVVDKGKQPENSEMPARFVFAVTLQPGVRQEFGAEHLSRVTPFVPAEVRSAEIEFQTCLEIRSKVEIIREKLAQFGD